LTALHCADDSPTRLHRREQSLPQFLRANLLAMEGLYETGQHRLHLIDLSLLARFDLTAKFLDFRILSRAHRSLSSHVFAARFFHLVGIVIAIIFAVYIKLRWQIEVALLCS
jgi:hypothetical protein